MKKWRKSTVEQILGLEDKNKSKRTWRGRILIKEPMEKVNIMILTVWDRKIITKFTKSISSLQQE